MRHVTFALIALLFIAAASYFVAGKPASRNLKSTAVASATTAVSAREPASTVSLKGENLLETNSLQRSDDLPVNHIPVTPARGTEDEESLLSGKLISINAVLNRGSATGLAAAETYLWAAARMDHDSLGALVGFKTSIPGETRSAYQALIPRLVGNASKEIEGVSGVQFLDHQVFGPNDELVRFRLIRPDGSKLDEWCLMRRTDSGWKRDMAVQAYMLGNTGFLPYIRQGDSRLE